MELLNLSVAQAYLPSLLNGLATTVGLTCVVIVLAGVAGIPIALLRMCRYPVLRWITDIYVEVIRGTPLLLQLFYIYYVLPSIGIAFSPVAAGIIGLTMNYSAYMSEVYRAGINSVPKGQAQAAQALGMRSSRIFMRIVLPQAMRIVIPALGNFFISLFKDSALTSVITVSDLLFTGQSIAAHTYQYFTVYTLVGILYLAAGVPAAVLIRIVERRFPPTYNRRPPSPAKLAGPDSRPFKWVSTRRVNR